MTYGLVQNAAGNFVKPDATSFQTAAASADWAHAKDFYLVMTNAPGAQAYPVTATVFILMYKQPKDAARSAADVRLLQVGTGERAGSGQSARLCPVAGRPREAGRGLLAGRNSLTLRDHGGRYRGCRPVGHVYRTPPLSQGISLMQPSVAEPSQIEPVGWNRVRARRSGDPAFRFIAAAAAFFVLLSLGAAALSMLLGGMPAFARFGFGFLYRSEWNPVQQDFGALVPIYGTLMTSVLAMLLAVPVSFGIALFLTEVSPRWMRGPIASAIELLAGIPSIIYGMWGLFVFVPFMSDHIEPWLIANLGPLPIIGLLFDGPPLGIGMLTAGVILAVMVIPFISSIMRDVFSLVPPPAA